MWKDTIRKKKPKLKVEVETELKPQKRFCGDCGKLLKPLGSFGFQEKEFCRKCIASKRGDHPATW
jgi:hypothetical protein